MQSRCGLPGGPPRAACREAHHAGSGAVPWPSAAYMAIIWYNVIYIKAL